MTIGNTPRECDTSDTAINRLIDMENPNAGKQAIRYGREILMMHDRVIEHWPTANRASERLSELHVAGYFVGNAQGDHISYRERVHCGPTVWCGEESARIDCGPFEPNELRTLPAETDDE